MPNDYPEIRPVPKANIVKMSLQLREASDRLHYIANEPLLHPSEQRQALALVYADCSQKFHILFGVSVQRDDSSEPRGKDVRSVVYDDVTDDREKIHGY